MTKEDERLYNLVLNAMEKIHELDPDKPVVGDLLPNDLLQILGAYEYGRAYENIHCHWCGANGHKNIKFKSSVEIDEYRDEIINVRWVRKDCKKCQHGTTNPEHALKMAKEVFDTYNKRKNLLTGDEIKAIIKERGLTIEQISKETGLREKLVERMKKGFPPENLKDGLKLKKYLHEETL